MVNKLRKQNISRRGFTLIELLVVIAIIGVLSSVVLASLSSANVKARDAKRNEDIHQIQDALEEYYDNNGHYPITEPASGTEGGPASGAPCGGWTSFDSPDYGPCNIISPFATDLTVALAPYIGAESDPKSLGEDSGYLYVSANGTGYCILFWRTPEDMRDFGASLIDTNRCPSINESTGQCVGGTNSIYLGVGSDAPAGGC